MVTKQKLLYQLELFETLKDTPNTSEGFRFVAFLVLEILGWVLFDLPPPPPPWCLVWVPKPLVPEGLKRHLGKERVNLMTPVASSGVNELMLRKYFDRSII